MRLSRWMIALSLTAGCLILGGSSALRAKTPSWQPGEHPRLLVTTPERGTIYAKLNAAGTTSNALWQYFVANNNSTSTNAASMHYADAGFLYWATTNPLYGQRAHDAVMNYVNSSTNLITPTLANYDLGFWLYRDMLLNFDFAYDTFSTTERQQVYARIALQGSKCHSSGPAWGTGNIHALWGLCEYASAVMLEGENVSIAVPNEAVIRQASGTDKLKYPTNVYSISISAMSGGPESYTQGVDYTTCFSAYEGSRCIDWSPAGAEPSPGTTYYVTYTAQPQTELWRIGGRQFIENHLNYHWRDGTYTGGFHPYSGAALESVIDMLEIARRDMGVDYTQDVDLKRYIDMALYEKLPSPGTAYTGYRYDTLSDSGSWGEDPINHPSSVGGYRGWARRMTAYGLSRYGSDPEYGPKYLWFWSQYYRKADGTIKPYGSSGGDWREALYFNDTLVNSYPVTTLPTPDWPTYRFFRGRDLAIVRTDHFDTPDPNAAYLSFFAQNHNHQSEHDQSDSGSFTFYSNNEDWAIDPGYQASNGSGGNSFDHNTVGIDGAGVYANGVYGQEYTTPAYGGFSHIAQATLTEGAAAMKADLTHAWSLTETPFLDHQYRYLAMINGGPSSYLVVGDDIQKDTGNHTYQWYFSTAPGNTMTRTGAVTTIGGTRNHAQLDIHTIAPASTTETIENWQAGSTFSSAYKRLTIRSASTVNPRFLHLLIPTPNGTNRPVVTQSNVTNGVRAVVTWSNGMVDTIWWRTNPGTIVDDSTTTDAALTIIRTTNGTRTGVVVMDGRTVTQGANDVFRALDGTQPATFSSFDGTASVSAVDTARVRIGLAGITAARPSDGRTELNVAHDGDFSYITAGLPFDAARQNNGRLLAETFTSTYVHDLVVTNFERFPTIDQAVQSGVLDLRTTNWDWVSRSRRDSTPWRRSNLTPSAIPADSFGDADYSFKFRFTDATAVNRKFRFYFRVSDHNAQDWLTNQDYLRLEFDPIAGRVVIGQRVNGTWVDIGSNDALTATTANPTAAFNDTNWHQVLFRMLGSNVQLTMDGTVLHDGAVSGPMPGPGYLQWRVAGTAHVQLDDLNVISVDLTAPATPDTGTIQPSGSGGLVSLSYNRGQSPDLATVSVYRSPSPITPTDDPGTLTLAGQGSGPTTLALADLDRTAHYAAVVTDTVGNRSQLVALSIDNQAPAAVSDLTTR